MLSELEEARNRYARLRRWDPECDEARRLRRYLAVARIRKSLETLPEEDARIVLRQLVKPKEWA